MTALTIWLFGVFVFIPLSASIAEEAALICSIIILVAFTAGIGRSASGIITFIKGVSSLLGVKNHEKLKLVKDDASAIFRSIIYTLCLMALYLLYRPFLMMIHFAISGLALVLVCLTILGLATRVALILLKGLTETE